ncbi:MAG TPA: hypothetical protein VM735_03590 [Candidatus Kapabacteria bacterium]|nr:hypothetical protein [Candidatus Kapabacteria bacterium]
MKKAFFLAAAAMALSLGGASAAVVRPAPNINWVDYTGKLKGLSAFKGQPIVVIVAPSPLDRSFRAQVGQLQKMYERYAAARVVFVVAFTQEPGRIKSNIPFAIAGDGPRVAFDYQTGEKFGIAIVGRDGNLDYVTGRVLPAQRIFDVINNSFVPQESLRRP